MSKGMETCNCTVCFRNFKKYIEFRCGEVECRCEKGKW